LPCTVFSYGFDPAISTLFNVTALQVQYSQDNCSYITLVFKEPGQADFPLFSSLCFCFQYLLGFFLNILHLNLGALKTVEPIHCKKKATHIPSYILRAADRNTCCAVVRGTHYTLYSTEFWNFHPSDSVLFLLEQFSKLLADSIIS
jgi:hypothetical protein